MKKGKLIRVQIGPGQYRKMYEADAIAAGHIKAAKAAEKPQEKQRPQTANKMREPEQEKAAQADDFTKIDGVGPATARALVAHGITTFDQLRHPVELDYLTPATVAAIETWRNG